MEMVQLNIGNARLTPLLDLLHRVLRLPTPHPPLLRPLLLLLRLLLHFLRVLRVLRVLSALSALLLALLPRLRPLPEVVLMELLRRVHLRLASSPRPHFALHVIHADRHHAERQQLQPVRQQVARLPQHLRPVQTLHDHEEHALHEEAARRRRDPREELPLPDHGDSREEDREEEGQQREGEVEIARREEEEARRATRR